MHIHRIEIHDLYGTKEVSFEPGSMTVLTGANGSGKSSVLKAILSVFAGGSDPSAVRSGAKKGTISIELADRPNHVVATIKKSQSDKGSSLEIRDQDGQPIAAAQTWINSLAESLAVDPARLLSARPKELVPVLLELVSISFTPEEIQTAIARNAEYSGPTLDLDGLDGFRKKLYEERTRANALQKDAEGTVKNLTRALPEGDEKDWKAENQRLVGELESLKTNADKKLKESAAELQNDIDEINKQAEKMREEARQMQTSRDISIHDEYDPQIEYKTKEATVSKERAEAQSRVTVIKEQIEEGRAKVKTNSVRSTYLTIAMESLDELKRRKLDQLPVPGLEVRGDRVLVDGVPFEHVNTARRVEVAFQICALRAGDLPFLVIDNSECLDTETWVALQDAARGSGFQIVAARVADGPLSIEVVSEGKAAKTAPALRSPQPVTVGQENYYPD